MGNRIHIRITANWQEIFRLTRHFFKDAHCFIHGSPYLLGHKLIQNKILNFYILFWFQVEAKAARIKDWVTNKLRELEEQNQHLRVQNAHCFDQMNLLNTRLEQLQVITGHLLFVTAWNLWIREIGNLVQEFKSFVFYSNLLPAVWLLRKRRGNRLFKT